MPERWVGDGERLAFLGDSLTQGGWEKPDGWVRTVVSELGRRGVEVEVIPAGMGGHRSVEMAARLQADVLDQHPDAVLVSCGVNDVWGGDDGVALDAYSGHLEDIVIRCQAAGARVAILTSTIIGEDLDGDANRRLASYNDFLRDLAGRRGCLRIETNGAFVDAVRSGPGTGDHLTDDGVHFNTRGEAVMAAAVLEAIAAPEP
jgi:lysophospholipase L1-like esterase